MAVFIGNLGEYKEGQEDFESYTERFEQWMIVNEVGEDKKANVFLSVMGAEAYALLKNLCIPDKPSRLTYEVLCGKLSSHYKPKPLVIAERFKFQKRNQQENESVSAYVVALKQLSTHCEFGPHLDEALRDRFVSGLRVEAIQRKLLTEHNLTFAKACELSLSMEMASKNTLEFASKMKGPATVNRIDKKTTKGAWQSKPATSEWRSKTTSDNSRPQRTENHQPCYRCGGSNHAAQVCRYKTETCHKCSKVGHIARMCTTKDRQGHTQYVAESSNETTGNGNDDELFGSYPMNAVYPTHTVGNGKEEITVNVQLEGTPLEMQLDTGAAVTLVSEVVFKKHLSHLPVKESKVQLSTFSGEKIPLMGQVTVSAKYGNQRGDLPLVIVKGDRPALLGRNWLTNFRLDWASIFSVTPAGGCNNADVEAVLQKHKAVFSEELGTIREFKASITVKPNTKPVFRKARPVPYALKDAVEKELNRLEKAGIISKIEHSQWAAPIVVVPKSDKSIRICGDYKVTVNQNVEEENYPLPNVEDLFATLAGGTLFSKLDLSHAYQQLELEKDSEKYLTITTHKGLYVYHRLSYGVSKISQSTLKDPVLCKVLELTRSGWPSHIKDERLKPYFTRKNELSVEQGCILWGIRVIIPPAHRERLLRDLHQGHPGGCKMKALARSYLWWPQLDSEIEHAVQQCDACQSVRKLPAAAPLHCWQWPTRVWQRIHIDFAEKDQHHFLVLVDSHSKWLEVIAMATTTAAKTIEVLRNIFSSYGLPEEIVSDNGPQFTSQEYKTFLQSNGIKQTLVPAYHPASNGAAERAVQTVKASLLKQVLDEKKQNVTITMQHRLANFLMSYRSTPHSVTGCAPAELFLKRQIRTRFSLLKPDLARVVEAKQQKQKDYHDQTASKLRHLSEGDSVLIRNFRGGKERWMKGTVEKRLGPVTYLVWNGVSRRSVHIDHLLYNQPSSPETLELPDEQLDVTNNYPAVVHADLGGKGTPGAVGGSPYSPEATPLIRMQANETLGTPSPDSVACDKAGTPANRAASSPEVLGRRYPVRERAPPKRLTL
ncbi:hypothetical protein N1851_017503 [Merluccius polli]|uniref:Gypsy retrotransposon integrase-like protein 1 n=1 Tax=Merluccius polli TaxID=89951 RepID=A0AA47NZ05_MERPO|nr:hypothetical protein N1851_017503 [Merluccius polli]